MENAARFDKEYLEHVHKMRAQYFSTGSQEGITEIRPDILACWKAYNMFNQTASYPRKGRVTKREYAEALKRSQNLISVAEPYMQLLRSFLKEDSFWITLMDDRGIVLKLLGSPHMLKVAESTDLVEGSYRGEDSSYPGLFYACRQLDKPFQIVSAEHPSEIDDIIAGSASPIYEHGSGRCLGIIGISGYWENSHDHTLGLTILAAEAISQQLALCKQNADIAATNQKLNAALEAVDFGAVYFCQDGSIFASNGRAVEMLCASSVKKEQFVQKSIFSYLDGSVCPENFRDIEAILDQDGVFSCDLIPAQKYNALHCSIRRAGESKDEYFLQMQKASDFNKSVAAAVFSQASFTFRDIIGQSASLQSVKDTAEIAAKHSPAVLITGESGTGKEMFAQAIHNCSPRANGPFVAINCGAIPKSLIESELFGYEAGAFTGAQKGGHIGKFELANKGTIFLDEIGDMPYEIQVALLRVLQTKEVIRIGGKAPVKIDVRVIAATNQNLEKRIADNTFRQDLYYRLNVLSIHLPALRDRLDDILPLSNYFIQKYSRTFDKRVTSISQEAQIILSKYSWPGNIRELENIIERAIIVCKGSLIEPQDLPDQLYVGALSKHKISLYERPSPVMSSGLETSTMQGKEQREFEELTAALQKWSGNLSEVAKQLGVSRPTIYRKLKKYGLHKVQNQYER